MKLIDYLISLFMPSSAIIIPMNPNDSIELRTGVEFIERDYFDGGQHRVLGHRPKSESEQLWTTFKEVLMGTP